MIEAKTVTDQVPGGLSLFSGEYGLGADQVENFEVGHSSSWSSKASC